MDSKCWSLGVLKGRGVLLLFLWVANVTGTAEVAQDKHSLFLGQYNADSNKLDT